MKSILKLLVSAATAAVASLLQAGCQNRGPKEIQKTPAQNETVVDTTKEDTMEAFYERIRRWKVLYGGMSRQESDK